MDVEQFDFDLPEELIAQTPIADRSASRMMVLDPSTGEVEHGAFTDILRFLKKGDCLVLNDTRVLPARLFGTKDETGANLEVLLLKTTGENTWETLVKPAKRVEEGTMVTFGNGELRATCVGVKGEGRRDFHFDFEGDFNEILDKLGEMPLPPYIHEKLEDRERYQTVYSKHLGSAAAPTAGLHFTEELLDELRDRGVHTAFITLHVGIGTFRPVKVERVEEHKMHGEFYVMTDEVAGLLNNVRRTGGRIVAVGTTVVRTLETIAAEYDGAFRGSSGWTEIFIYPGYHYQGIDGMITNFHLPKSTLVMMVSAFAGREHILGAYREAVRERYRFFSFGDAMLILEKK
ncbi:MAG TPA: tRNA preQ1(34) S-adenosylmethionine ribosyltransferase-isomerase QueA, partial [Bacillales bacterium]|nr:tRNA preQ1(34) S-adenosylmethionine ribosyltransferase-isomerase QueA [Bacillales bacterium]